MNFHPSYRYAMLVCALPPLPSTPFAIRQAPLSRLQLDRRLALLTAEDAGDLAILESMVHWERIPLATREPVFLAEAQRALNRLSRHRLRAMLSWRLELRTLVGALRRRHRGFPAPGPAEVFGFGECMEMIRRHWAAPDFRLGHQHPWISVANDHLRVGQHHDLERLLLGTVWDHYTRLAWDHHFDFEAVALYVLRWNLIDRLTRHDASAAAWRFWDLLTQGLDGHGDLPMPKPRAAAAHGIDHD